MKERSILFSGPMVRAILDGSKTQTRRIVKECDRLDIAISGVLACPYGQRGERLWVREAFDFGGFNRAGDALIRYKADLKEIAVRLDARERALVNKWKAPKRGQWRGMPAMFLLRSMARPWLENVSVRIERLNDISEEDAIAEGLSKLTKDNGRTWKFGIPDRDGLPGNHDCGSHWKEWNVDPRRAYARLWESINGKGSWAANPWVWVVEFRRVACAV